MFIINNLINLSVEPFDVLIMHDCSRCPINKKNDFHRMIKTHSNDLKEVGIEPVLMMTWPYKDEPKMIETLSNEYIKAANENQILVIPVGLAFAKANEKFSKINLYTSDNRHPSKAGTYLGACVIFSALYKKSPENNPYHFGLEPEIAKNLQKLIPRQMFDVPIQVALGAKIISRETVKAFRKNVTAKLYGGDVTRKMKLLEKQKQGKKKMKQIGKVSIPQDAFLKYFSSEE